MSRTLNMSEKYYVYGYIDPTNMKYFYIGKGSGRRFKVHLQETLNNKIPNKTNKHLYNKIKFLSELGNPPIIQFLYKTDNEIKAYEMEKIFIEDIGFENLCNLDYGGNGGSKMTEEQKRKLSKAHKGKKLSPELRIKAIANLTNRGMTPKAIEKMKETKRIYYLNHPGNRKGVKLSAEIKKKLSEIKKGIPTYRRGIKNVLSKIIYQYNLNGDLVNKWYSTGELIRVLNYSKGLISEAARGKRKTAYGFIWSYKEITECAA